MKKIFSLALAASMMILGASCSKETKTDGPEQAGGALTLVIKGIQNGATTYAVPATTAEKTITSVDLYRFNYNDDSFVDKQTLTVSPSGTTVTGTTNYTTGDENTEYAYYVVANDPGITSLTNFVNTPTTLDDFLAALTNVQSADLGTPFLMTGKSIKMGISGTLSVTVTRVVSRFDLDISNLPDPSLLSITNIYVSDIRKSGALFPSFNTMRPEVTAGAYKTLAGADLHTALGAGTSIDAMFYLYPTTIGTQAGETGIAIEASYNGSDPKLYYIGSKASVNTRANTRYKLIVNFNTDLNWEIKANDNWNDAEETFYPINEMEISNLAVVSGNGTIDKLNKLVAIQPNDGVTELTFTIKSPDPGVKVEIENLVGNGPACDVNIYSAGVLTYAAHYLVTVNLEVSEYTGTESFSRRVKFYDESNPEAFDYITVYYEKDATHADPDNIFYPGTALKAVKVEGIYWAPVNIGASAIDDTENFASLGYVFQWGRNVGFNPTKLIPTKAGPVTYAEAHEVYRDYFITAPSSDEANAGHWLDTKGATWSMSPCPSGWRMPTKAECEIMKPKCSGTQKHFETYRMYFVGDNPDEKLYFPLTTRYSRSTGAVVSDNTSAANIWTTDQDISALPSIGIYRFIMNRIGNPAVSMQTAATAMSVRCVLDMQ